MLDSYRAIKIGLSQWSSMDERVYRIILDIQSKYTCLEEIMEKNPSLIDRLMQYTARFQPLKPFTFTHEKVITSSDYGKPSVGNNVPIPVQHKYAEVVLIPCLLPKNSQLRNMADMCKDLGVDMICSDKCVKVGKFHVLHLQGGTDNEGRQFKGILDTFMDSDRSEWNRMRQKFQKALHLIPYNDFRIQNSITEHNKESLFGTQVRKLALGGIRIYDENGMYDTKDYTKYISQLNDSEELVGRPMVDGVEETHGKVNIGNGNGLEQLNGKQLMELYNGLVVANMLDAMNEIEDILGDRL